MTSRANTYVTDLQNYLDDETGDLADMPAPALALAMFLTSIVAWVTSHEHDKDDTTNVWCWRRPGHRRCREEIVARLDRSPSEIWWQCPHCGVNGVIRGWKGSLWDHRASPA
jgi:hypothetical protein